MDETPEPVLSEVTHRLLYSVFRTGVSVRVPYGTYRYNDDYCKGVSSVLRRVGLRSHTD